MLITFILNNIDSRSVVVIFILKTDFEEVLNKFFTYKVEGFKKNNYILRFVHDTLSEDVKSIVGENYKVIGSVGKGNWADCPNVVILDEEITESAQDGFYLVYLFKKDMSGVYLSLEWGSNQFNNDKVKLRDAADEVKNLLIDSKKIEGYDFNKKMDLASGGQGPKSYEAGSIVFNYYPSENFPDDETLNNDLKVYLDLYGFVKENYDGKYKNLLKEFKSVNSGTEANEVKEVNIQPDYEANHRGHDDSYTRERFMEEVYIDEDEYDTLVNLLKYKKNLILEGAPGVGKTFLAKRLAYAISGVKDYNCVMMVQFHQSYSYEDFVMGYRPTNDGFELKNGPFYNFCKKAENDSDNDYFFIIDEINRGNLSKIFGELFMLIENDKRGEKNKIHLLYSDESFFIPENVYIIGLMNTADRSLAMIDYALRRRFAFFDLKPGFDSEGFKAYQSELDDSKFDDLIWVMKELNQDINDDESLGEGFRIGHSYLCNLKSENIEDKLNYIVEYELIPLLKEYWFDEPEKVNNWSARLRSVLNDS